MQASRTRGCPTKEGKRVEAAELPGVHFPGNDCLEIPMLSVQRSFWATVNRGEFIYLHKNLWEEGRS